MAHPLHILSLETSHLPGSVALAEGAVANLAVRCEQSLPDPCSTARSFAPSIRDMLAAAGIQPPQVGLVAVDIGPGSFTGLRIAATFAKTFAYASGADLLGISCMDILAHQAADALPRPPHRLWTVVDAHRRQLFAARYDLATDEIPRQTLTTQVMQIDRWYDELQAGDVVTGPVVERLLKRLPSSATAVAADARTPTAHGVAQIAWQRWRQGVRDDMWRLTPDYFRKSAAEERLDKAPP